MRRLLKEHTNPLWVERGSSEDMYRMLVGSDAGGRKQSKTDPISHHAPSRANGWITDDSLAWLVEGSSRAKGKQRRSGHILAFSLSVR